MADDLSGVEPTTGAHPDGAGADSPSAAEGSDILDSQSSVAGNGAGLDDDDEGDDDFSDVSFNQHPRFKQLTRKLSKTQKQNAKLRAQTARFQGVDVESLHVKARTADQLQDLLARNPGLRKQFVEAMNAPPDAGEKPVEDVFDPTKLPFDVSDASGKFFADFYQQFLQLQKQNALLARRLDGMNQQSLATHQANEVRAWQSAVKAAQAQLPEHMRDVFHDAVYGAFKEARERRMQVDPQRVIDHYLTRMGVNRATQAKASDAAKQRIAERNQSLPRQPQNPGAPASARGDRRETVADVNRRLKAAFSR